MKISVEEARSLVLKSQGLLGNASWKENPLTVIEHLGYIQIDTLAVIARAHHHTLWSRTAGYQENILDQLLQEKKVFEYWSHAASYLPMRDFRFSLPCKQIYAQGKSHWFDQDRRMKKYVLDKITAEGPLQSKDFEDLRKSSGSWYTWKPAKRALEQLFMEGKLMVAERKGFQKLYDLTERVLPPGIDITPPSEDEFAQYLILIAITAHGIVTAEEIGYLRGYAKKAIAKNIRKLLKENIITTVQVEDTVYYTTQQLCETLHNFNRRDEVHILSPFDNVIIQRNRLQRLFGFDYTLECYVPEHKRKFGYFCLPVLYDNKFVARLDPKTDRTAKTFYIRRFHAEKGWKATEHFKIALAEKLKTFAAFNGCEKIAGDELFIFETAKL
jgi:uncharacterized protein YcaQ